MALSTHEFVSVLNDLIQTCRDGEEGYRQAAEHAKNPTFQALFREYSQQRNQYARDLQTEVTRLGQKAETSGSTAGSLHRGWLNLKSAIAGSTDQALIDECESGEDAAVAAYRTALAKDLPADLRAVVERQNQGIQAAHAKMRDLKHSGAGSRQATV